MATCLSLLLTSCASFSVSKRVENANRIAASHDLQRHIFMPPDLSIVSFLRINKPDQIATIYIEGDGYSWINRTTLSSNPTPIDPIGLKLAAIDKSRNIIYLARPCQYVDIKTQPKCTPDLWSSHRYSNLVLSNYHLILNKIRRTYKINKFHLVGFSGGAAITALLTASRDDIASLRTVAGNLNHTELNKRENVSALHGSLDAIKYAQQTRSIPQAHYYGAKDTVIPGWVSDTYVRQLGKRNCSTRIEVPKASHLEGWMKYWKTEWENIPSCG
ncbi:alpha/beta fold hydrolase [Sneathiella glossodoripedis]|uniref:alpha/beta fold hydrolase n=1 Tax=Sneathiella glossodoripedis TaxID=418853 RepID=UPI0011DD1BDC|nr:alpha/beta hydrolase [Sneathiella glossodoripedis]